VRGKYKAMMGRIARMVDKQGILRASVNIDKWEQKNEE
jgi:hypothetical protein